MCGDIHARLVCQVRNLQAFSGCSDLTAVRLLVLGAWDLDRVANQIMDIVNPDAALESMELKRPEEHEAYLKRHQAFLGLAASNPQMPQPQSQPQPPPPPPQAQPQAHASVQSPAAGLGRAQAALTFDQRSALNQFKSLAGDLWTDDFSVRLLMMYDWDVERGLNRMWEKGGDPLVVLNMSS
jgi:hypothetical protein